jgi:phage regulator Rha-like protein
VKTPAPNKKHEAGAPGKVAAIVIRPAKSGNSASDATDLVTVEHGQPVTTTERIAAAAGLQHKNVLALVREHLADFREFGEVAFQTRLNPQGSPTEYAELNEPQAALLFLYQRNTKAVRAFKLRLVKDFARVTTELQRLKAMRAAPAWQAARIEAKRDFCNVADMLQEVRADAGKDTGRVHHMNEAKLIRFALTGSETAKWDRDTLSRDDLKLLGKVERLDMRLIARGVPFHDRKASCRALVLEARGLLLKGAA